MYSKYKNYIDVSADRRPREVDQNPANPIKLNLKNSKPEKRYNFQKFDAISRNYVQELNLIHSQHYYNSGRATKPKITEIVSEDKCTGFPIEENYSTILSFPIGDLLIEDNDDGFYDYNTIWKTIPPLSLIPEMGYPMKPFEPPFLKEILYPKTLHVKEKKKPKKNIIVSLIREPADTFDYLADFYKFNKDDHLIQEFEDMYEFTKHFFQQTPGVDEETDRLIKYQRIDEFEMMRQRMEREALQFEISDLKDIFVQNTSYKRTLTPLVYDVDEIMRSCSVLESCKTKSLALFRTLVNAFFYYNYCKYTLLQRSRGRAPLALYNDRFF